MMPLLALLLPLAAIKAPTICDYSTIAVARIEAAKPADWTPGPRQTKVRKVELRLTIEQMLKGRSPRESQITIEMEQAEPGSRTVAVPGAWSEKSIETGTRYVLFSRSDLSHSDRVEAAASLTQVKFVLEADRHKWGFADLRFNASPNALGPIAGEYVLARLDEALYSDAAQFDALLTWLESPGTPASFRLQVASVIFSKVISADPAPQAFWSRLAVGGFRMAGLPNAGPLGESILSTYLPNLLGLAGGATKKTPEQVFGRFQEERDKARSVAARSPLLSRWIEGR